METTLLATKLFIPRAAPGLVLRQRLIQKLQGVLSSTLTLVSAPAGFGKTTVITQWLHANEPPVPSAWLSLEEAENDPVRFWDYFIAALRTTHKNVGETSMAQLHSTQPLAIEATLLRLINDLTAVPGDTVIVLDDYQFIQSTQVHQGVTFLLEHMPPGLHLVVTTRVDPPLPLAHFRGKGTLLEIGADDLRFTGKETASLLTAMDSPALSAENVNALNARAEGWAVGLKMAALSMKGEKDIAVFVANFTGSQRYVMDYLAEEVLRRQPPVIRDFLLRTSVLQRMSGPLCDAINGRNDGRDILLKLENENLFIISLDKSREWYRYEHLFADLLRHRLELESGIQTEGELQKKASLWFERNGYEEDAIHYALAASDWARALYLILNIAPNLINTYGVITTYNWLRPIPQEVLLTRRQAWRYYVYTLAYTGHSDMASNLLDSIEKAQSSDTEQAGYIAASRAHIAFFQSETHTEEYARRALSLLPRDETLERAVISHQLGVHYSYAGRVSEAEPLLTEAYSLFREGNNNVSAGFNLACQAGIAIFRGRLYQAEEMSITATQMAGTYTESPGGHVILGRLYYEWNDLLKAASEFEKAIELSAGSPVMIAEATLASVPTMLAQGDTKRTIEALERVRRVSDDITYTQERATFAGCQAAVAEATGDEVSLFRWLDEFCKYDGFLLTIPIVTIRLLHERTNKASERRLKTLYDICHRENLQYFLILERIGQAIASTKSEEALSLLGDALAMGKPEGYIRTFVDWGILLAPLLRKAVREGIEPEYARKLLDIIETEDHQRRIRRGELLPTSTTPNRLSERETDVLRFLAEGLSNQEIARKLVISTNTAKAHVRHILQKLDARDRLGAVMRAKELKLI